MESLTNPKQVYNAVKEHLQYPEQEELLMLSLDRLNSIKVIHFLGLGTDSEVLFSTKIIAKAAVLDMACGVILVHTHPSGNPTPSGPDIEATDQIRKALSLFDINLIDHIIIAKEKLFSFDADSVLAI